jgi:hypothetical protein
MHADTHINRPNNGVVRRKGGEVMFFGTNFFVTFLSQVCRLYTA